MKYFAVGIVPLSAEPTLSKRLSHKILTSSSDGSRGHPQPTEGFESITVNKSCIFSSSLAKNVPHLTRDLQTKKPNKHRKEQGLFGATGWFRRGRKSKWARRCKKVGRGALNQRLFSVAILKVNGNFGWIGSGVTWCLRLPDNLGFYALTIHYYNK